MERMRWLARETQALEADEALELARTPGAQADIDLVALFLDTVERLRPPMPPVVVEHPERCTVAAEPDRLALLLRRLVLDAMAQARDRAEIRLVLGSRPGCSFFLQDNGHGNDAADRAAALSRPGVRCRLDCEAGWGCTVYVQLDRARSHDGDSRCAG